MSIKVKGVIEYQDLGAGAWALVSDDGNTYELHNAPSKLCQTGQSVTIQGNIREDVMTMAMIGPVLEVKSFEIIGAG